MGAVGGRPALAVAAAAVVLVAAVPTGAGAAQPEPVAGAAGLRIGRIPECDDSFSIRGPLSKPRNRRKLKRAFRCLDRQVRAAQQVLNEFMFAIETSDGDTACRLLSPAEWERIGGRQCHQRVADASVAYAGRDPYDEFSSFTGGRDPEGTVIVRFQHPRDAVLLELGAFHRHWRLVDTNNFFP